MKTVKNSPHAWPLYALGAEGLFENEPSITLGGVSVETGEEGKRDAAGTILKVSVTVKDGDQVVDVDAAKVPHCLNAPATWLTGRARRH